MEKADGAEDQTPRARGRSGRWLVIHGSLTGERDGRATGTAIMLEEAKPIRDHAPHRARGRPLRMRNEHHALEPQGLSAQEIAAEV